MAYSVLPVIAELPRGPRFVPRVAGHCGIASQQAITASPISAATVAPLGLLAGSDVTWFDIPKSNDSCYHYRVTVEAPRFSMKVGKELAPGPEHRKRLTEGYLDVKKVEMGTDIHKERYAVLSRAYLILCHCFTVIFGLFDSLRSRLLVIDVRDGETRHVRNYNYRNRDALSRRPSSCSCRPGKPTAWKAPQACPLPAGTCSGGDCHIRHCLDGRYFSSGKHASVDPVHRGNW